MNTCQTEATPLTTAQDSDECDQQLTKSSLLKMFGREVWHNFVMGLCSTMWLPRLLPLVSLVTCVRDVSPHWLTAGTVVMVLCYAFAIGRSDPQNRTKRIAMQIAIFSIGAVLLKLMSGTSLSTTNILTLAAISGGLGAGGLLSCFFPAAAKTTAPNKTTVVGKIARYAVAIGVGIGLLYGSSILSQSAQNSIYGGQTAPATVYHTADDDAWSVEEHRGKVVLVEFWAPWCAPCVASFPHLKHIHEKYSQHEDFEMVSVSSGSVEQSLETFSKQDAQWRLLFPPSETGEADLRPYGIPSAYIIDRDGKITAAHIRGAAIDAELEKLFGSDR